MVVQTVMGDVSWQMVITMKVCSKMAHNMDKELIPLMKVYSNKGNGLMQVHMDLTFNLEPSKLKL